MIIIIYCLSLKSHRIISRSEKCYPLIREQLAHGIGIDHRTDTPPDTDILKMLH